MSLIKIRSIKGEGVSVSIVATDITQSILAEPWPTVEVAPATEAGRSTVRLTLVGDVDLEVDGEVAQ